MKQYFLSLLDEAVHVNEIGSGKQLLFAFHGYGLSGNVFEQYKDTFQDYTIIAIDLPFHGATKWNGAYLTIPYLEALVHYYCELFHVHTFTLMGYSLGGKICMNIVQHFPKAIEKIILLAPDGLAHNRVFDFATKSSSGKKLFRYAIAKPKYFITTIQVLEKIKLIPERNKNFYVQQLNNRQIRLSLYKIWNSFNQLRHEIPIVIQRINEEKISLLLIMGKRDKLIKIEIGEAFAKKINNIHFVSLAKGHQLLDQDLNKYLLKFVAS